MVAISIKDDLNKLKKDLDFISKSVIPSALPKALNKIGKSVESVAIKTVSKKTKIKQKDIRKAIVPNTFKASKNKPFYIINFENSRATNLIEFVTKSRRNSKSFRKRTKKGFKFGGVSANAWGDRKQYDGTFIGRGRSSGKLLVFKRNTNKIVSVAGPSPRLTFEQPDVRNAMKSKLAERFSIEMDNAIGVQLRRLKR